ncbi:protein boule-like, partial [Ruditapes philippinarum]|uniref:protein boule-like n=1 Tax=Ruditapes philippinarum TaxID=129788 RepID=UPI00295A6D17
IFQTSSGDVSPSTTPCGTPLSGAPKFGTVIPNRIFVGGIAANTTEQELKQFFSAYGAVKDSKIIADRAGVSKGYGFITFENQEDADRIIKKESDNLVFRDRKLNIGPQVLPRAFESPVSPGAVMFSNGVPYTYQNGMAVFASPEAGYAVPQAQPQTALMVPQTPPVYVQPQYATYQVPVSAYNYTSLQTSPQWATTAAAAAANAGQWRYMTQSPTTALTATANPYMIAMQPDLMYAQVPQAYQAPEFTDATVLDGTAGVEGSISMGEQSLQQLVSQPIVSVTEAKVPAPAQNVAVSVVATTMQYTPPVVTCSMQHDKCIPMSIINSVMSTNTPITTSSPVSTVTTSKHSSVCAINVAPYKKPIATVSRRNFTSPFIVRNGHKVQCLMVPPKNMASGQYAFMAQLPEETGTPTPWSIP